MSVNTYDKPVAIVTGSASGIGKTIAQKLYNSGAFVVVTDIQQDKGQDFARSLGDRAIFIACDVSEAEEVFSLVNRTVAHFGRLDIMVNNAGVNGVSPAERVTVDSYPDSTWKKLIDVDLNGTFYCCKAAAQVMIKQKSGSIINIASVAGVVALRLQIGFVAAKAAVIKMSEAMACELAPHGIRVNTVSPGSIATEATRKLFYNDDTKSRALAKRMLSFIPQARPGEANEIADAVIFLASQQASYINGHNLVVDGGWICGFNRDF